MLHITESYALSTLTLSMEVRKKLGNRKEKTKERNYVTEDDENRRTKMLKC